MTPELLPMILSLNLSKGSIAMSEKGAIVKHPESIQNFGSMDMLCTDKTGTLTENQIALVRHLDTEGNDSENVLLYSYINSYFDTGLKSPLDDAILRFRHIDIDGFQKIDEIPFDFIRKTHLYCRFRRRQAPDRIKRRTRGDLPGLFVG